MCTSHENVMISGVDSFFSSRVLGGGGGGGGKGLDQGSRFSLQHSTMLLPWSTNLMPLTHLWRWQWVIIQPCNVFELPRHIKLIHSSQNEMYSTLAKTYTLYITNCTVYKEIKFYAPLYCFDKKAEICWKGKVFSYYSLTSIIWPCRDLSPAPICISEMAR